MTPLRNYMKANGVTQVQLAKIIGVQQPSVWAWLHGKKNPSAENLARIAAFTGISEAKLAGGKRQP